MQAHDDGARHFSRSVLNSTVHEKTVLRGLDIFDGVVTFLVWWNGHCVLSPGPGPGHQCEVKSVRIKAKSKGQYF